MASGGLGINNSGQVVGAADISIPQRPLDPPLDPPPPPPPQHAFLYSDGIMYDLNALVVSGLAGVTLVEATGINDSGQIVANTCNYVAGCQAFRLDPVMGPGSTSIPTLSNWALAALVVLLLAVGLLYRRGINP